MPQVDPKFTFWFGVWTNILIFAAGYGVEHAPAVVAQYAPSVQWCAGFLAQANGIVLTSLIGISSSKIGPLVNVPPIAPTVVKILLVAFALSAFLAVPSAQAQTRRPTLTGNLPADIRSNFEKTTGVKATGDVPFDLLKALDKALLPDLQYADKLAQATGSKVTEPCYEAWIAMINTQQTAVQIPPVPPATDATEMPVPDPHLVTSFERMVELRNALQPDSPFMTACSPVANMVKMDVTQFMGVVISGGAGLATLVPGL